MVRSLSRLFNILAAITAVFMIGGAGVTIWNVAALQRALGGMSGEARAALASSSQAVFVSLGAMVVIMAVLIPFALYVVHRGVVRPIVELAAAARAVGAGGYDRTVAPTAGYEIGEMQRSFNEMVAALGAARAAVADNQRTLEARVAARTADLEHALADLRGAAEERERLSVTVRELASPVIPVSEGVLVMPLVGAIDTERAAALTDALLRESERHRARTVILDVTGVPVIDTAVARALLHASAAARLMGTSTMLVGLRPELAQTIVGLGLNLAAVETSADLQTGLRRAAAR